MQSQILKGNFGGSFMQVHLSVYTMSVYLEVAMHQSYVLSPLLFGVVMDIVPSEARRWYTFLVVVC